MLESIQIRDFAIIDRLQLELEPGMSVLTGETGAGKSIMLDAIKLVAGDRAESENIRSGSDKAEISVCFRVDDCAAAADWLEEHEMGADGECVLRRVLHANGRSKAFINGYNATLAQLRKLCDRLIDIHGQHEHHSLQRAVVQRQLLDSFIGDAALLDDVRQKYDAWQAIDRQLQEARSGAQERQQRIDLLGLYCAELNELKLESGEVDALQHEYRRLSNAGRLLEKSGAVLAQLYADDEHNLQSAMALAEQQLAELLEYDAALAASHELVAAALIQVQEASSELRAYRDGIELDDARLEAVNQRIATVQGLARKHRVESEELIELGENLNRELAELQSDAYDLDALQVALLRRREEYDFSAAELSARRQQTAALLSEQITRVMQELGMGGGSFVIDVKPGTEPGAQGLDDIVYRVSANPGQPPKPLAKVASGGELSRISLAIQVIMSESSHIPTLIFDEVDSGVGGGVAEIVGKKLRQLGGERQVLCVTHLPQVASQAHHHYRVEKTSANERTSTAVFALGDNERLEEVARMLGGVTITEQTRAHASEMIAAND